MNRILLLGVAGSALFLLPGDCADAGCRHVQVVQQLQAAVQYQPVYAQPYLYSVGANLQTQASEERIANLVIQKLQAAQVSAPGIPDNSPQTLPLTAEVDRWQLVKANCAGCHSTSEKAMEHVNMTDLSALTCEQKLACIAALSDGTMPKKREITPQERGNLIGELSGAKTAHQP